METPSDVPADPTTRNARFVDVVPNEGGPATINNTLNIQEHSGAIVEYAQEPLLPLAKACIPLAEIIYNLLFYVQMAIEQTPEEPSDGLTIDESAAVRLYTIEWGGGHPSLYTMLNGTLKRGSRDDLRPYFKYLKLFLTALAKLPCAPVVTVWRGVTCNLAADFPRGTRVTWWGFSSCTTELTVLQNRMYLGTAGARTLFSIETINGRSIKAHSHYKTEDEILLLAGTQMVVKSQFSPAPDLHVIHLKQIIPEEVLLQPPFEGASLYPKKYALTKAAWNRNGRLFTGFCFLTLLILGGIITYGILGSGGSDDQPKVLRWKQNATTVAGGNGVGNRSNQVSHPYAIHVGEGQSIYVLEYSNSRIMKWAKGATDGEIVVGRYGDGNRTDQLHLPTDMIVNEENNTIIITDGDASRVVRWPLRNGTSGEILTPNGGYIGLAMNREGYLYVSDNVENAVRRWRMGDKNGTLVAGGNGNGTGNNQFISPSYITVDRDEALYVSDSGIDRVMKWVQNATEGVVAAGCGAPGISATCLSSPRGILVDELGTLYIADASNHRVISWSKGASEGTVVVGGNGMGSESNQLHWPISLAFDEQKNLYVADYGNSRIQKFNVET